MDSALLNVLSFALLPVAAAIVGAMIAAFRPPNSTVRSYIQHLAAGVVFSVVAVELLPEIVAKHAPVEVAVGFALGVLLMLGIRYFTHNLEEKKQKNESSVGLLVAIGVDVLLDGLLIGISFSADAKAGRLLTFALMIELLSLGLAVAVALGKAGKSRLKIILTVALLSLLIVVGAAIGATVLREVSTSVLEIVLSFGLAALLFLVTEELLVEAHEEPETPLATATFFGGFLLFLILGMIE
ncbi:MAG: ZIP family metal transporter [Acidobacteriota bacterium]